MQNKKDFDYNKIKKLRDEKGISQEELAELIGVTKSTISQWEQGKKQPRKKFEIKLENLFTNQNKSSSLIESDKIDNYIFKIPYYENIKASAGGGTINEYSEYKLIQINHLPKNTNKNNLFCITVTGDSMEPVLKHGSIVIVDKNITDIIDGNMYVFRQDDFLRVKKFSYEKHKIKISSYNSNYSTEYYSVDEIQSLQILGKVIYHATKID